MAQTHKVLGQSNPGSTALTTLYTAPSATSAVCSTIAVCNQAATPGTYRIAVRPAGESIAAKHYLVYDATVGAGDSVFITIGLSLAATDVVSVYASSANQSFSLFGVEIT
jgi:hypothetical protein